ncbi:hypothetical protein BpHYR1_002130 [Brachionus plicatilis]|uniref:Uncharacterized protein n=1 Tax=Brachionus plicatilis TaxID=10195 RepID=A0A3M7RXG7_BRAPC|nr:hypothetical protein BpHYR1_002130 [Brachionus plicatilis]
MNTYLIRGKGKNMVKMIDHLIDVRMSTPISNHNSIHFKSSHPLQSIPYKSIKKFFPCCAHQDA